MALITVFKQIRFLACLTYCFVINGLILWKLHLAEVTLLFGASSDLTAALSLTVCRCASSSVTGTPTCPLSLFELVVVCLSEVGAHRATDPAAGPLSGHYSLHSRVKGQDGALQHKRAQTGEKK